MEEALCQKVPSTVYVFVAQLSRFGNQNHGRWIMWAFKPKVCRLLWFLVTNPNFALNTDIIHISACWTTKRFSCVPNLSIMFCSSVSGKPEVHWCSISLGWFHRWPAGVQKGQKAASKIDRTMKSKSRKRHRVFQKCTRLYVCHLRCLSHV